MCECIWPTNAHAHTPWHSHTHTHTHTHAHSHAHTHVIHTHYTMHNTLSTFSSLYVCTCSMQLWFTVYLERFLPWDYDKLFCVITSLHLCVCVYVCVCVCSQCSLLTMLWLDFGFPLVHFLSPPLISLGAVACRGPALPCLCRSFASAELSWRWSWGECHPTAATTTTASQGLPCQ